ncbi:MAG: hypothetical protein R3F44_10265 [Candidatus Competibacteraceae bacterium]
MTRKLYIKTHGCQMNEYDSAKMADVLRVAHGLERTDDPDQADVLLLNTCSIREKPRKRYSRNWVSGKPTNPAAPAR